MKTDGSAICWPVPSRPFRSWPGCKLYPSARADCWTEVGRAGRSAKTAAGAGGNDPGRLGRRDPMESRCWSRHRPAPNFSTTSSNWKRRPRRRFAAGRCASAASVGGCWRTRPDLRRRRGTVKIREPSRTTDDADGERMDASTSATIIPNYNRPKVKSNLF